MSADPKAARTNPPLKFVFDRREKKFLLPHAAWDRIAACAERYLPVERFDDVHQITDIRTTYLDTPDLSSYREYVDRRPIRKKVRIRQYGYDGKFNGQCWVEVKIKNKGLTHKRRFCCAPDNLLEYLSGKDIQDHVVKMNRGRPEATEIYRAARSTIIRRNLRPIVRVDYHRISFQDPTSDDVRITVDRAVRFQAARNRSLTAGYDGVVMELKYGLDEPAWFAELLRELSLGDSERFSKFAHAIKDLGLDGERQKAVPA